MAIIKAKTKILATLGPATDSEEMILKLVDAGVNGFRLNFSHGDKEYFHKLFGKINHVCETRKLPIPIIQDLQGPKIRIGKLKSETIDIQSGNTIEITIDKIEGDENIISSSYQSLISDAQIGEIILIDDGIVVDYAMNTLCAAGTGSFLSSQARRLGIPVEEFGTYSLRSKKPVKIAGRCTVFAESDLVHKAQMGYSKEDLIAGVCNSIVFNYLNNVGKGKNIGSPIVFQGGVSKNKGVVKSFKEITGEEIIVDDMGHLMGAIGIAILARDSGKENTFDFSISNVEFQTVTNYCGNCPNNCEVVSVLKEGVFLDGWGNRCPVGIEKMKRLFSPK